MGWLYGRWWWAAYMASVQDVAAYILRRKGAMSAMRLQKLVYYSQAWHLVWHDRPLFQATIEAWAHGPVCPALYRGHRQQFRVADWPQGDARRLDRDERETVDLVLGYYGDRDAQWLSDLTHMERPWKDARRGLPDGAPGNRVISHRSMQDYYANLPAR